MNELDEASLLAEACERTGLTDFGDDTFREPLGKLLEAIEREAHLTAAGRAGQRTRIVGLLAARLERQAWLTRHREIEDEHVEVRFVVVGFPRTGTTLLQRILAQDPRSSWLAWWECAVSGAAARLAGGGRHEPARSAHRAGGGRSRGHDRREPGAGCRPSAAGACA
ncbi:MAG: sulfotransferase [Gammaproteobacteria bacterium]|nr:sulfotransferase [Gammaproteobacteria bacterium]